MAVLKARLKDPEEFFYYDGTKASYDEFTYWQPPMYSINGELKKGSSSYNPSSCTIMLSGWKTVFHIPPDSYIKKTSYIHEACIISAEEFKAKYKKTKVSK
jgi:hypothetical protein